MRKTGSGGSQNSEGYNKTNCRVTLPLYYPGDVFLGVALTKMLHLCFSSTSILPMGWISGDISLVDDRERSEEKRVRKVS